jgi:hypothetical protein
MEFSMRALTASDKPAKLYGFVASGETPLIESTAHIENTLSARAMANCFVLEGTLDTLKLCRAMEAVCVQHALSDTRLRERWLDLMDDWNIRAHNEAARRFHENHDTQPTGS